MPPNMPQPQPQAKPTAKSMVKPMGAVTDPNAPDAFLPQHDETNSRFVIELSDGDCEIKYEMDPRKNVITYHSTIVPEPIQGMGIGKKLAKFAFDYAAENKLDVLIKCSFLAAYYMQHRDKAKYKSLRVTGRYAQEAPELNY